MLRTVAPSFVGTILPNRAPVSTVLSQTRLATAFAPSTHVTVSTAGTFIAPLTGFGFCRYLQLATASPITLAAGQRTLFAMAIDPTKTINTLKGSFAGQAMWDGSFLRTPNVNDVLEIRVAMNVTAGVAGGNLKLESQIANTSSILDTKNALLPDPASTMERVAFEALLFSGPAFVTDGVQFYLTSSVPVTSMVSETVLVAPISAGP